MVTKLHNYFKAILILIVLTMACVGGIIIANATFTVHADDSNGIYFEVDKNPIERVYVVSDNTEPVCGESITLDTEIFPESAKLTVVETTYRILIGGNYAHIEDNTVKIDEDAPIGSRIIIAATVDGVESENYVTLIVQKTPVERIEIINTEEEMVVGSSIMLETMVYPETATNKSVQYSIISGNQYASLSYSGALTFNSDANLPEDCVITVRATSSDNNEIFADKSFKVVPLVFDSTVVNEELKNVEQSRTYMFDTDKEPYASIFGDKATYFNLDCSPEVATIDAKGLLYVNPTAPIGSVFTVDISSSDGIHYLQKLEVVPVYATSFVPILETEATFFRNGNNYYMPGDVLQFNVVEYLPLNVSECNRVFEIKLSDNSLARVDGNSVIINENITKKNPSLTITVVSEPNRLEMSFDIDIYVKVDSVILTKTVDEIKENSLYNVGNIFDCLIYPQNAFNQNVAYYLESESLTVATLEELRVNEGIVTQLRVKDNLPTGEIRVGIYAVVDGVRSETVWYNVYKPAKSLSIKADNNTPISCVNYGETVSIFSEVNAEATRNYPTFNIIKGAEFIDGNITYVGKLPDGRAEWQFRLKKNLANVGMAISPIEIISSQTSNGVVEVTSNKLIFDIYIPNESLSVTEASVTRNSDYRIVFKHTENATDKSVEWRLSASAEKLGIQKVQGSSNEFHIPKNLSAGNKIIIEYRSADRAYFGENGVWKQATFTVSAMGNVSYKSVFDNGIKSSDGFNIVFGKDRTYTIGKNGTTPQLENGQATTINFYYSGEEISKYGMKILREDIELSNADIVSCSDYSITIRAKKDAVANAKINLKVSVSDGTESYRIAANTVYVFRKLSGKLSFGLITDNGKKVTDYLNKNNSTFDFNANDGIAALKFNVLNQGGVSLSSTGVLKVTSYTANKNQKIQYSYQQSYNGTLLSTYNGTSNITLNSVKLNNNGGSGRSYYTVLKGMNSVKSVDKSSLPSKSANIFMGYGSFIDKDGNVLHDFSNQSELKANWTAYRYIKNIYNNEVITDNGDYSYSDTIDPDFDIITLKSLGYKSFRIQISYDCKEINDGWQDIKLYNMSGGLLGETVQEHGSGYKDTNWGEHYVAFDIDINSFPIYIVADVPLRPGITTGIFNMQNRIYANAKFRIGWGAHGNFGDDWELGDRKITIEALK